MRVLPLALALPFFATTASATPADQPFQSFADLLGHWTCSGVFPASGKTMTSELRFDSDLGGKAMLKHHDDTSPPSLYHAVEAWGYDAKSGRYNATILDNFGGARMFSSEGWTKDGLVWTSAPEVQPAQRFIYVRQGQERLRVDWEVERKGAWVVGDTLTCERH